MVLLKQALSIKKGGKVAQLVGISLTINRLRNYIFRYINTIRFGTRRIEKFLSWCNPADV